MEDTAISSSGKAEMKQKERGRSRSRRWSTIGRRNKRVHYWVVMKLLNIAFTLRYLRANA
jgi:hypothetical protein